MKNIVIFPNVKLGKGADIEPPVIIGKPPRGKKAGDLKTVIGDGAVIRAFSVIYAGVKIGKGFQSGHGVLIREDNIIGDNVSVGSGADLEFANRIGNGVRIHSGCFLESVTVEDDVFIGPNTVFTDDPHPMKCARYRECSSGAIVRRLAKIGANVTVLPSVKIGKNSLIGAGSVVTKDVPANAVVAGNPARYIKDIKSLKCRAGFFKRPYIWKPYI